MLKPIEISQLNAEDKAIEAEIGKLIARRGQIAAELHQDKIAKEQAETAKATEKHAIRWIETSNFQALDTDVELHGPNCQHLRKYARSGEVRSGLSPISDTEQWASLEAFAKDYNADFYAEEGIIGCWGITAFPCTGMVSKKTTTTGY